MADEVQKLILEIQNEQKLRELVKLLAQEREGIDKVTEAHKQGKVALEAYEASLRAKASRMVETNNQIAAMQQAAGPSAGMRNMGMMQAGYLAQDVLSQHTLAGAINAGANNIPGIAMGMGAGPQAMIGVAIATAVAQALATFMPQIVQAITGKNAEEEKRKEAEQKSRDEKFKDLISQPTAAEAKAAAGARAAITSVGEEGAAGISAALSRGMGWTQQQRGEWIRGHGAEISAFGADPGALVAQAESKDVGGRVDAETKRLVTEAVKPGGAGMAARARIRQLARQHPGTIPPQLVADLEALDRTPSPYGALPFGPLGIDIAGTKDFQAGGAFGRLMGGGAGPPAFLPSPSGVFGTGVPGAKSPEQQAREQAQQTRNAQRAAYRANMGQPGQAEATQQRQEAIEAQRLEAKAGEIMGSLDYTVEQAANMPGPATQALARVVGQLEAHQRSQMQRNSRLNGGAGNMGQFSAAPLGPW